MYVIEIPCLGALLLPKRRYAVTFDINNIKEDTDTGVIEQLQNHS